MTNIGGADGIYCFIDNIILYPRNYGAFRTSSSVSINYKGLEQKVCVPKTCKKCFISLFDSVIQAG
jgi:hypothetical protein